MHIARIEYQGLPPIKWATFDLDERVNLFIGPNASGKSTTLRAIKELHSLALRDKVYYDAEVDITHIPNGVGLSASDDWPRDDSDEGKPIWSEVPFLYIPATRINLPLMDAFGRTMEELKKVEIKYDGNDLFDTDFGIFNGRLVERWIGYFSEKIVVLGEQKQFRRARDLGYSCVWDICSEVIYDPSPHSFTESLHEPDGLETILQVHHSMGIGTSDNILGEALYVGALSSGTQGTLLWVWALAIKMAHHYGWTEGWEKKPAILLIDEIENHLHPTWQRRVIPALLRHFPGLQIFAATHSPFVVAGLQAGQAHLLKRDENGRVTATTYTEDVIGWTSDEILRNMMGVEDPTDNETAEAARELRQLRNERPRSDPEEEEERQRRMQELRELVSRDLLAGGPEAAQRELFEQQFAEALQKYRQSQGLNQENG